MVKRIRLIREIRGERGGAMRDYKPEDIRNIALVGGQGTGKTSLAEGMLYQAKATTRLGKIVEGNTVCDYQPDEIERRSSINLALATLEWNQQKINLVDTPGYSDFIGEALAGLTAAETALLVISTEKGVAADTEKISEYIQKLNKPTIVFLNNVDKAPGDFAQLLDESNRRIHLGGQVSNNIIPLTILAEAGIADLLNQKLLKNDSIVEIPQALAKITAELRDKLIENIAVCDDMLTDKYLEGKEISSAELQQGLKKGIVQKKIIPLLCGSAESLEGVKHLLDFITDYLPSPSEVVAEQEIPASAGKSENFCAFVFKTILEPRMGRVNYLKILKGKTIPGMDIYNSTKRIKERIGQLYFMQGKNRVETTEAEPGDLVAVVKLKATSTNDTLTAGGDTTVLPAIEFPPAYAEMAVYGKRREDEGKISNAISSLIQEDPTLKYGMNPETKELLFSGIGDLQLEIMARRAKERYGIEMDLRRPRIAYKETIHSSADVEGKYKRQTGGHGQYGDVWLKLEPLERGKGFEFVDKIVGGRIPKNYIPAVEKGTKEAMEKGVIAGYPVVDLRATLYDGSFHEVDSSDLAFKIAASMALQKGVEQAQPTILEPIMDLQVKVPEAYTGQIMGDLNGRRGRVLGIEPKGNYRIIKALVPQAELYKYGTNLRSLSRGTGSYEMSFSSYEECPQNVQQTLKQIYREKREKGR